MRLTYEVTCESARRDERDERDDSSFRLCLCTLLLLVALFGIISIFLWRIGEKLPVSHEDLNRPPYDSFWYGKRLRDGSKTSQAPPTQESSSEILKTTTTSEQGTSTHSTSENKNSSKINITSIQVLETTEPIRSSEWQIFSNMGESTPDLSSLLLENETEVTTELMEKSSTDYLSLRGNYNVSEETTFLSSDDSSEMSDGISTSEPTISEDDLETTAVTDGSSTAESTSEYLTTLVDEKETLKLESTEGTSPDLTSADAETSKTSTTSTSTPTPTPGESVAPLTCPDITCPTLTCPETTCPTYSCPDCPVETCPKTSCPNITCPTYSCPDKPCPKPSCPECPTVTCPTNSCPECPVASCPKTSCPTTTCPTYSCPVVSCPTTSCPECPVVTCPTMSTTSVPATTVKPGVTVCQKSQCYVTAARILSLANVTVDPCEDFYSYACGGMFNNPAVPEDDPESDVWRRIEKAVKNISSSSPGSYQKVKSYYNGCVNYDKLVSMEERKKQGRKILDSFAKFVDSSSTHDTDLTELLIKLFQHGSRPLVDLRLDVDSSNSSRFQLVVTVPDSLHSPFYNRTKRCQPSALPPDLGTAYEDYKNCMGNFSEFLDTTQKALEFFGVFEHLPAYNASQLIQEIRMSMEFDVLELLREYPSPDVFNKETESKTYKLTPKVRLEAELPMISWSYLFSSLLNVDVSDATNVQVYFLDYLKKFFGQLETKSARTVHNSLLAMYAHDLYLDLVVTHGSCDRERYCLRVVGELLPVVTSNLYLDTFPPAEDKELRKQVVLTYQHLEAAMEDKISKATWLDEKTSSEISKKLKFMSIQLPRKFNDSILNSSLGECPLEGGQYLEDSVCLLQQQQRLLYSRYLMDPHAAHAMWPHFLTAFSTHTAFIYGLNTFMIPLAVIRPVYDPQMPSHVVMAALGNVLARGIGHNFDHTGVKFVAGGKIGMMLSEATNPTYEAVVENSNMQFSWTKSHREDGKIYSYLLEPELTLNERLSDITATNLSLTTVLATSDSSVLPWTPFSPVQTYFMVLAQTFCTKKRMPELFTRLYEGTALLPFERVFNMAANSEQFALAFRCPLGTTMNMASELKTRPFPTFSKMEPFLPEYS